MYCVTDDKVGIIASERLVILGMEEDEQLVAAGMVHLRVFQGQVSTMGFDMPPGMYFDLYSPRWSNLMTLKASSKGSLYHAPCTALTCQRWAMNHVGDLLNEQDENEADTIARDIASRFPVVIVLRAMKLTYGNLATYFDGQTSLVRLPGFKFIRYVHTAMEKPSKPSRKKLKMQMESNTSPHDGTALFESISSLEPNALREMVLPSSWHETAVKICSNFTSSIETRKVLVCGAKGVGKSTYTQFLVNRFLESYRVVAYIDTDVGQPELGAPGVLSLHYITDPILGPSFTHMQPAYRSYYFGFSSPKADPQHYMQAIGALIEAYTLRDCTIPLVINTDGWIKSMGYDLLQSIIDCAAPQHIVQVVAMSKAKSFDIPPSPKWTLHPIDMWDSTPPQPARSSKELRQYRWHSYFLRNTPIENPNELQLSTVHNISEQTRLGRIVSMMYTKQVPYRVPFAAIAVRVAGSSAPPSHILYALNASVVGLCVAPSSTLAAHKKQDTSIPTLLLDNPLLPCVGHGIVRSIDVAQREFHILTPLPLEILKHVNVMVRGHLSLSFQLLDQNGVLGHTPYAVVDVLASEGTGASLMESRNNLKLPMSWIDTLTQVPVQDILSSDELELLELEFKFYDVRHRNSLDKLQATKLFEKYMPQLTGEELQTILALKEGHGTFQLSLLEYTQIQAAKKYDLEIADEDDLKRHFTVLDYHGNGSLVADEILDALERTGDPGVNILKNAVASAANMVTDGKITFAIFRQAIHEMNRATEAKIASESLRLYQLRDKIHHQKKVQRGVPKQLSSIEIEFNILQAQIERQKKGLITVQNDIFSKIYAAILAQYICETSVLRSFQAFFNHLHTEDSHLFRHGLERSGRMVDVHPSFLLYPGPAIENSSEYTELCNFMAPDLVYDSHGNGPVFTNRAYRKIFIAYCLLGSLTNFQTISRSNFIRFIKDCALTELENASPLRDPDIDTCFVLATRNNAVVHPKASPHQQFGPRGNHFHFQPVPHVFQPIVVSEEYLNDSPATVRGGSGMNFEQWVYGATLVLQRCLHLEELPTGDEQENLFRNYILPKAKQIEIQTMGPEISQPQVMQFIRQHVWPLKQVFSHFGGHSLSHIELGSQLSLHNFLLFARCFDILRSTKENNPRNEHGHLRQLSLHEVVQEYNAAKLDIGFSKAESRESLDLNFHEFLRCIQRLAMAMGHSLNPLDSVNLTSPSLVSSFRYLRAELNTRDQAMDQVHLFKHARHLHVRDFHFSTAVEIMQGRTMSNLIEQQRTPRPLPPLHLQPAPVEKNTMDSPRRAKDYIQSTTKKCLTPRQTHLPIVSSPRYSATRPFSLGGSPHIRTIRSPSVALYAKVSPIKPQTRPPSIDTRNQLEYDEYQIPPLSSRERSRTPYQTTTIVQAYHCCNN
ncbi:hypothetical protein THRCLA_11327 [Thraustotheca clavata]|uniref:Polynucleotide 5'-hydroxyl-kinase NOL9 n=1 Tax=Thraustotheca clavata TaxID=74557 RepID=A0A1V9Y874_9STRA|nr:hypothetical protein THRCLA_11327 [Thraustotheca clavata]